MKQEKYWSQASSSPVGSCPQRGKGGAGGGPDLRGVVIPPGQALVVGDHRGDSADGRYFGLVPVDAFYGKAVAVYWRRGDGPVWKRL